MTERAERLLSEVLELSLSERAEIADTLVDSLGELANVPDSVEAIDEEFGAEIERRVESIRNGTAELEPSEKVMREVWQKYYRNEEGESQSV